MPSLRSFAVAAAVALASVAAQAQAWSYKEHIQFTRLAATRIAQDADAPADLRAFMRAHGQLLDSMAAEREYFLHANIGRDPDPRQLTGLCWWVLVPDIDAGDRGNRTNGAFNNPEQTSHFVDLEFFNRDPVKRTYQLDGSALPPASDIPRDVAFETFKRAGYLPFSRLNAHERLVAALRAGRLSADPAQPESTDHAVRWAAYLAHYSQDNTQPHHATMDYKSELYFKGLRNPPTVHSEVEYRMVDDPTQPLPELRAAFWDAFTRELAAIRDEVPTDDPFDATIAVSMESYRALPLIGSAAQAALRPQAAGEKPSIDTEKFFRFVGDWKGKPSSVLDMKAHQTAWAVVRTERAWRYAWAEAHRDASGGAASQPTSVPTAR